MAEADGAEAAAGRHDCRQKVALSGYGLPLPRYPMAVTGSMRAYRISDRRRAGQSVNVLLSLFRRRQPRSRRKEGYLAAVREALKA